MKLHTLLIAAALLSGACAFGNESETTWNYSTSTIVMSRYYGSIVGGIFYPGTMSFTDFAARKNDADGSTGFDLSLGQKLDRSSYNRDSGNEYDFTVDRMETFGSADFPVKIDLGVCYLAVHDLRQIKDDFLSPYVRLDLPKVRFIQPYVTVYRFDRVGNSPEDSGWFFYGGFIRSQPLGISLHGVPLSLTLDYRLGYSEKLFGTEPGLSYERVGISLPLAVARSWTITPTVIEQFKGDQPSGRAFAPHSQMLWTLLVVHPL